MSDWHLVSNITYLALQNKIKTYHTLQELHPLTHVSLEGATGEIIHVLWRFKSKLNETFNFSTEYLPHVNA